MLREIPDQGGAAPQNLRLPGFVAKLSVDPERLDRHRLGDSDRLRIRICRVELPECGVVERVCQQTRVPNLARQFERRGIPPEAILELSLPVGNAACSLVGAAPQSRIAGRKPQRGIGEPAALVEVSPDLPEAPQVPEKLIRDGRISDIHRPLEGGTKVVVVPLQSIQPHGLIRTNQVRCRFLGQCQVCKSMICSRLPLLAGVDESLVGELADRLQHAKAWLWTALSQQTLIDQLLQCVEDRKFRQGGVDRLNLLQFETAVEGSETSKQCLLGWRQAGRNSRRWRREVSADGREHHGAPWRAGREGCPGGRRWHRR